METRGTTVAITGAGSGIGRALAMNLAAQQCKLSLADLNLETLEATCALLPESTEVLLTALDVADEEAVNAWASDSISHFGHVDMVINNAGVSLSGMVNGLPMDDYRWIMGVNFWGSVYGSKAFLSHFVERKSGHIVNLSSVFGIMTSPLMSGYNASKFAIRGFTESMRQEQLVEGNGVQVSCVCPGGIKTNIAKASRNHSTVEEMTGQTIEQSVSAFEKLFITTPEKAAETILKGVRKNRARILIGPDARAIDFFIRLLPSWYQSLNVMVVKKQFKK